MRRIAISDIHGCLKTFYALLLEVKFSKQDQLYLLGDYIDRGPDSIGLIEYIWQLQQSGYSVLCLRGNHEQMLIDRVEEKKRIVRLAGTSNSFKLEDYAGFSDKHIQWMKQLGYFIEVDGYILVHAGLNFKQPNPLADFYSMMWIRDFEKNIDRSWLGGRIIVHGHSPTTQKNIKQRFERLQDIPSLCIDNGCAFQSTGLSHLLAFDLTNKTLHFQKRLDVVD